MDTDFLLIRKMKTGDGSASDEFVRKYYPDILKYCSFHCTNKENAQDLTQETFIRFFSKLANYHHEGKAKNYLYRIAGNLCIDESRKKKEFQTEESIIFNEMGKEDSKLNQTENQIILNEALQKLSKEEKDVIILYYFQELKIREIAEILQISISLTKYRLKHAKQVLKELIGKENIYES